MDCEGETCTAKMRNDQQTSNAVSGSKWKEKTSASTGG